jgi:type II secretory pathway component PulF
MNPDALDDFFALNAQLTALVDAGAPLEVGLDAPATELPGTLERINAVLARRIRAGATLEDALQDHEVPAWYRTLILSGLRSGNMNVALVARSRVANVIDESRQITESAFFYPLVICTFAYLGLIGFCLFIVPTLESTYNEFNLGPGRGLRILIYLRDTLPYWVAAPLLLLALFYVVRLLHRVRPNLFPHRQRRLAPRILRESSGTSDERAAYFAESLASLEESQMPLDRALLAAADACGDPELAEGARALASALSADVEKANKARTDDSGRNQVPPFLRWAILDSQSTIGRASALQMASTVYRQSAARRIRASRVIIPIIVLVAVGGGVTLLYGLALFTPILHLLRALSA